MTMSNLFAPLGTALKSLKRNFSVTLASIATVTATILIFGIFLMVALSVNHLVKNVEEQTVVRVFMENNAAAEQKTTLEQLINSQPGLQKLTYEDRVTAFNNAKLSLAEDSNLLEGFNATDNNPYPDSYIVNLERPDFVEGLVAAVQNQGGVESVSNDSETVNSLINWAKTIRTIGVIIFAILILVSLFLIGNSIKLAVFGRRKEIEIMKFVGATNWYIRWPFIIEGIIIGILGAGIAVVLLFFGYRYAYTQAQFSLPFISLPSPQLIRDWLSWQFLIAGMLIGALGSFFSIRKHLNV